MTLELIMIHSPVMLHGLSRSRPVYKTRPYTSRMVSGISFLITDTLETSNELIYITLYNVYVLGLKVVVVIKLCVVFSHIKSYKQ